MALEVFVIYNKNTGLVDGGTGRVRRSAVPDGSTMKEGIAMILAKSADRRVVYFPNQPLPDPEKHKVESGKIVDLTKEDLAAIEATKPKTEVELLKDRIVALESD